METIRQAVLTDRGFEIRTMPMPRIAPDEVLVRILGNGVCAGDVGKFKHAHGRLGHELLLGHEASGEVAAAGSRVEMFKPGELVTALGGFFAEYHSFSPDQLVRLPDGLDPLYALGEPTACCVHAMGRSRITPGDRVALVGCGFMGLVCLQLARLQGAAAIVALDISSSRRAMAMRLGATQTLAPERVDMSGKDFEGEYDVVIEAAGTQSALDLCGCLVRQHGVILIVGHHYSEGGMRRVYMNQWNVKALDVVNGHVRRNDEKRDAMARAMMLIAERRLVVEPLATCYPLARIQEAFEDVAAGRDGLFKAVVVMDERN